MPLEIERKFLVCSDDWKKTAQPPLVCKQGYMLATPGKSIRVRIMGNKGFLTIKGQTTGFSRQEFEYEIPFHDANKLLQDFCCHPLIEKKRYLVEHKSKIWEIDVFFGDNRGLIMAEIELNTEDEAFDKPQWAGAEVTGDNRYYNSSLQKTPFKNWQSD